MTINRCSTTYAILAIWLFACLSGMHAHYCFDGMEPPVSVHFDFVSGHDGHEDNIQNHKDIDTESPLVSALKVLGHHSFFIPAAIFLIVIWPVLRGQRYALFSRPSSWLTVTGLRPPLRAPPIQSY